MAEDPREIAGASERSRRRTRQPSSAERGELGEAAARLFEGPGAATAGAGPGIRVRSAGLDADPAALFPAEAAYIERAVGARQREFAAGRILARALLEEAGVPAAPLLRDADRVPIWPEGWLGSISHTREWCVAAVAPRSAARGIGVDVELDEPLKAELLETICTPGEIRALGAGDAGLSEATLHFSIKEAVYKACFPQLRERWDFQDVELEIDAAAERFRASPPRSAGGPIEGRVLRRAGFVLSAARWA